MATPKLRSSVSCTQEAANGHELDMDWRLWVGQFSASLEAKLRSKLSEDDPGNVSLVLEVVERELLAFCERNTGTCSSGARSIHTTPSALEFLPADSISPAEVLHRGRFEGSLTSLYRASEEQRLYCFPPRGKVNGRLFPEWQFVDSVPETLPRLLPRFKDWPGREIHQFWVSSIDTLDDLSPAEVLTGRPFESSYWPIASQSKLLRAPFTERLRIVEHEISVVLTPYAQRME